MKLFKSRKTYYLYNPNTLNYERVYPSSKDRLFTVLRHLSTGIAFGVATFFVMMHLVDSPMESQLRKESLYPNPFGKPGLEGQTVTSI